MLCDVSLILRCGEARDRSQGFSEFQVVNFHAIIEIEFDSCLGQRQYCLTFPLFAFVEYFRELVRFFAGLGLVAGATSFAACTCAR